jgi:hypothetical protein
MLIRITEYGFGTTGTVGAEDCSGADSGGAAKSNATERMRMHGTMKRKMRI